jgi:hypothetical protein
MPGIMLPWDVPALDEDDEAPFDEDAPEALLPPAPDDPAADEDEAEELLVVPEPEPPSCDEDAADPGAADDVVDPDAPGVPDDTDPAEFDEEEPKGVSSWEPELPVDPEPTSSVETPEPQAATSVEMTDTNVKRTRIAD